MDRWLEQRMEYALYRELKDRYERHPDSERAYHRKQLERLERCGGIGDGAIYSAMYHERRLRESDD